jgi:zinc/manganese transport system substrate-binding protein
MRLIIKVSIILGLLSLAITSCAPTGQSAEEKLNVVAAENFWGSLAAQLGGNAVNVTSIISNPNFDPHEFQVNSQAARAIANANLVIVNGVGYDDWALNLMSANPNQNRVVLNVGNRLAKAAGENPHLWYNPNYVLKFLQMLKLTYIKLLPNRESYFNSQYGKLLNSFKGYFNDLNYIRDHFSGVKIASTESIFVYMANYLHLDIITPPSFMQAVSESNEPSTSDVVLFENQIKDQSFKVLVYNIQTSSNLISTLVSATNSQHIPVIGISETIDPPNLTFQTWMGNELYELRTDLIKAANE